jgi:hypothetical protein
MGARNESGIIPRDSSTWMEHLDFLHCMWDYVWPDACCSLREALPSDDARAAARRTA